MCIRGTCVRDLQSQQLYSHSQGDIDGISTTSRPRARVYNTNRRIAARSSALSSHAPFSERCRPEKGGEGCSSTYSGAGLPGTAASSPIALAPLPP